MSRRAFLAGSIAVAAIGKVARAQRAGLDSGFRSIVISGDTAPSDNLVELAVGADILVHSVMYPAAIDRLVARVPNAAALKASILAHRD